MVERNVSYLYYLKKNTNMKKISILMLLASLLLIYSCRTETFSESQSDQEILNSFDSKIISNLISIKKVKKEIKNWDQISISLKKIKGNISNKQIESDNVLYRKIVDNNLGMVTYTLALTSYSIDHPYYLIQQIIVNKNGEEHIQYLKISPNTPPSFKGEDVLPTLTGFIETLDQNLSVSHITYYENGKIVKNSVGNNGNSNKTSTCVTYTEVVAVNCTNGDNHQPGQACTGGSPSGYAHYNTITYTVCIYSNGAPPGGTTPSQSGGLEGGYVLDEQLNSLLINPTFEYADYITDPSHNLLLHAVREWIPSNITDINGNLSSLNQRIKLFADNEQMFYDLEIYNQNTPNVMNAEAADYSIRVYEMFKFLMNYPTLENAVAVNRSVKILDLNRMISWNDYFPIFKSLGKIIYDNPDVLWEEIEIPLQLNIKINNINLLKETLEDWADINRVKPTTKFKKHAKLNCIYNKAKTSANFNQYLKNFDGRFSTAHLLFDLKSLPSIHNAETEPPLGYWIKININSSNLNRPTLDIARTFMHEIIHAEMFRILLSLAPTSNGEINTLTITQMLQNSDYPGLYDYFRRYGLNNMQHEQMAAHYRGIIKNFLKQIDNSFTEAQYDALSWQGLKGTESWNQLTPAQKQNIDSTFTNWNQTASHSCP